MPRWFSVAITAVLQVRRQYSVVVSDEPGMRITVSRARILMRNVLDQMIAVQIPFGRGQQLGEIAQFTSPDSFRLKDLKSAHMSAGVRFVGTWKGFERFPSSRFRQSTC